MARRKEKKYYHYKWNEEKKERSRLMRLLKKHDYSPSECLVIIDAMAGKTAYGKERESAKLIKMISEGAEKAEIFEVVSRYNDQRYILS